MNISIAERLRPFSHLPGTALILPGTSYQIQVFPCLIRVYHLKESQPILVTQIELQLKGPIQQFTICNDLEKGCLTVSGVLPGGWIRYHIRISTASDHLQLFLERAPADELTIIQGQQKHHLKSKETFDLANHQLEVFKPYQVPTHCMRLSLGSNKAQDWDLIKRRLDLTEIFPIWHRLGQLIPKPSFSDCQAGTLELLEICRLSLAEEKPEQMEQHWLNLFQAGFSGLLVPQLKDFNYQGLTSSQEEMPSSLSPLMLLTEGAQLITQLFFQQQEGIIKILPHLLPCFPQGRLLNIPLEKGILNLEWTKKTVRRLSLCLTRDQELSFKFRSDVREYRLREHTKDKGVIKQVQDSLFLNKNCHYFFDNFK